MLEKARSECLKDLATIPGVGKKIAADLYELGIEQPADMRAADPEELYFRHSMQQGSPADRCLLYVFRCAVYFASTSQPEPELLKWWNWKNRTLKEETF
jgi:hypothetical protein